jgi:hypothetical protein
MVPNMFTTGAWLSWRDSVFELANLSRPIITFPPLIIVNWRPDTRRMIINRDEVAAAINASFPDCRIIYSDMTKLLYREQLQVLQHASVMVSTQGSHSFRFMLLPSGARIVLVGNPALHARDNNWKFTPFFELPRFFSVTYVKFIKYVVSVDQKDEYRIPALGRRLPHWDAWNSDILVNVTKLVMLMRQALNEVNHEVGWRFKERLPFKKHRKV